MKALLVGGTGNISLYITKKLLAAGWEVTLLNRGSKNAEVPEAKQIIADMADETGVAERLRGHNFDVVAQFITYLPEEAERDIRLFQERTGQYIFISSASAYSKPPGCPVITESTPLHNPFWQYSRDKAACEDILMNAWRTQGFPVTVVRPSHTYGRSRLPFALHGKQGPWQVIQRIREEKPVVIPGDGTSIWTVTWADDFADGFIGLMGNRQAVGESFHITSDERLTWNDIHRTVAGLLGKPLRPCYVPSTLLAKVTSHDFSGALLGDKAHSVLFDNTKIRRFVPGFHCPTPFSKGAEKALNYLFAQDEYQNSDPEFDALCDSASRLMGGLETKFTAL